MMLVLSRKPGEKILIGDKVRITVVRIGPNTVRLGIDAPRETNIVREELTVEVDDDEAASLTTQHEGPLEEDGGPSGLPVLGGTERVSKDAAE